MTDARAPESPPGGGPDGTRRRCRACGVDDLEVVLDLGRTPVADMLLSEQDLSIPERTFPLVVSYCDACSLLQLAELLDQEGLYGEDYPYYTMQVPGLVDHFDRSAQHLLDTLPLGGDSLVVEAASNDGYMLRHFARRGIPVLGIDPAAGPAAAAEHLGVPTVVDYFGTDSVSRVVADGRHADLVLGNNVLNLVPDPGDFAAAVSLLLGADGTAVLEVPYVVDTVDQGAYDNFFHQNSSYFSLGSLQRVFRRHGLEVTDAERVPTFGGSLRVTLRRGGEPSVRAAALLADEDAHGVHGLDHYRAFAARAQRSRDALVAMLGDLRSGGARIIAYGAAGGMATTLLSYGGIDSGTIDYAVDANPHKHGWYTPGSHLLIRPTEAILEDQPDVVLLLAWNYADAVLEAQAEYRARGGRFLLPVPEPRLV